jgi:hypothetical protein
MKKANMHDAPGSFLTASSLRAEQTLTYSARDGIA